MDSRTIRETFLKYFESKGHRRVASSSLIPAADPTLIFANAGMNQFKDCFLGLETRDYTRATSSQKCVRAGGKHNDLDNVGFTARHHTFFEMLGNFSFGDYFKKDAIAYAWELSTKHYHLNPDKIWISVFEKDDEAFGLWKSVAGVPEGKIVRLGEKDNFWAMGEVGPCGPCSELYYDLGAGVGCGKPDCSPACDCGRYLEYWNLVFMQFHRDESGTMRPLPKPSIDTGAGLERMASLLQRVLTNYDTDLFIPIIRRIEALAGVPYGKNPKTDAAMRVIADHARATAFLVADGALPGNEGRGYVLRRIIRRSLRFAHHLKLQPPIIARVAPEIAAQYGDIYPEVARELELVKTVATDEETRFERTLETGVGHIETILEHALRSGLRVVPGEEVFLLYDTHGVPADLVEELAKEKGLGVDLERFQRHLGEQKRRSKVVHKFDARVEEVHEALRREFTPEFVGYGPMEHAAKAVALVKDGSRVDALAVGEEGELVTDITPFYAESGGQVGDTGTVAFEGGSAAVLDTQKPLPGLIVHRVRVAAGALKTGAAVTLSVDEARRRAVMRHHTATHLLHAALRAVLGESARQMGSLVDDQRLRFDFAYGKGLEPAEVEAIERLANAQVLRNAEVGKELLPIEEAKKKGALAFFGDKYGEVVRVVSVPGYSAEFCGGTHVDRTGDIGLIKIVSEKAIAAGVRRLEAVAGMEALALAQEDEARLSGLAAALEVPREKIGEKIEGLAERVRALEKQVKDLKLAQAKGGTTAVNWTEVAGVPVFVQKLEDYTPQELRTLADEHRKKFPHGIILLVSEKEGKLSVVISVSEDYRKAHPAGKLAKALGARLGGSGGGNPAMAQAGGTDVAKLNEALADLASLLA
jgi:alanyl-tRNA synthetase